MCPKYKRKEQKEPGRNFTFRTRNNGPLASFKRNVFKSFLAEQKAAIVHLLYFIGDFSLVFGIFY